MLPPPSCTGEKRQADERILASRGQLGENASKVSIRRAEEGTVGLPGHRDPHHPGALLTLSNELKASRNSSSCASVSLSMTEPLVLPPPEPASSLCTLETLLLFEPMPSASRRFRPLAFAYVEAPDRKKGRPFWLCLLLLLWLCR